MSASTLLIDSMPSSLGGYLRALKTVVRRPDESARVPELAARVSAVVLGGERLTAYREICGFSGMHVPITWPQVMAAPLHIHLMNRPEFPFPLLGLVHVGNRIEQTGELSVDAEYELSVRTGAQRRVRAGIEFDLHTELRDADGACPWRAVTTIIQRLPAPRDEGRGQPRSEPAPARAARYIEITAPADIGRRYGKVSGDLNPIHLYPWTARLFGFPRAIAHGMWSLARATALLEGELDSLPRLLTARFRRPLLLPARAVLAFDGDRQRIAFRVLEARRSQVHLEGVVATATDADG